MFELPQKVKDIIERKTGMSVEELIKLDIDEEKDLVQKITGKRLKWPKFFRNRPTKTIEEVDKQLDDIVGSKNEK